ncbi:unnamed protein product, partial [marine sediment metagenome]
PVLRKTLVSLSLRGLALGFPDIETILPSLSQASLRRLEPDR